MKKYFSPLRIAAVYAIFGAAWILLSDTALHALVQNHELEVRLQTAKGWFFIIVTGGLVYWLTSKMAKELKEKTVDRERVKGELLKSERQQHDILDHTSSVIYMKDLDGRFLLINRMFEKLFNTSNQEVIGKTDHEIFPQAIADTFYTNDLKVMEADMNLEFEEIISHDDEDHTYISVKFPIRDASGKTYAVCGISTNITERKLTEEVLRTSHEELEGKVEERTAELKEAKAKAEIANQAKSDFLASMSHELRTPLNAILGFTQILELNQKNPLTEDQKYSTLQITQGGKHLLELINEVLDLAKIEAGKLQLSIDDVSLRNVVEECIIVVEIMAKQRSITINIDQGGQRLGKRVRADNMRLKQVLLNLLTNAVKYNREGGSISLSCESAANDMVRISVVDSGDGIPEEKQSELFQPFSRLGAETTKIEGTGVGLTITKRLIEAMGGRIGYESEVGKGSTFWVELPQSHVSISEGADHPDDVVEIKKYTDGEIKVLYIEDNPSNLLLMEKAFEMKLGLSLITAHNAEIGIVSAEQERPDVILMDINLPGMNGIDALKELRNNKKTKDIPTIAISATAMPKDIEKGEQAGFCAYLTKPINIPEVLEVISDFA